MVDFLDGEKLYIEMLLCETVNVIKGLTIIRKLNVGAFRDSFNPYIISCAGTRKSYPASSQKKPIKRTGTLFFN